MRMVGERARAADGHKLLLIPDHVPDIGAFVMALADDVVPIVYGYGGSVRRIHRQIVHGLSKYMRGQFSLVSWLVFPDAEGNVSYKSTKRDGGRGLRDDELAFLMLTDVLRVYAAPGAQLHMVVKSGDHVVGDKIYLAAAGAGAAQWSLCGVCPDVRHLFNAARVCDAAVR